MSDVADYFNDLKAYRKERKRKWREEGGMFQEIENAKAICKSFTVHNGGEMMKLVIKGHRGDNTVIFWPSTKKWVVHNSRAKGIGVRGIIAYFKLNFEIIDNKVSQKFLPVKLRGCSCHISPPCSACNDTFANKGV